MCFFELVNLERDTSLPASVQPILQEVNSAKIAGPPSWDKKEKL